MCRNSTKRVCYVSKRNKYKGNGKKKEHMCRKDSGIKGKEVSKMRVERFKMEREGLVTEGQEVEISERSAVTGQYTYLVEPSIAMSGIYRTRQRIKSRKGRIQKIEQTDRGFYLLVEIDE